MASVKSRPPQERFVPEIFVSHKTHRFRSYIGIYFQENRNKRGNYILDDPESDQTISKF